MCLGFRDPISLKLPCEKSMMCSKSSKSACMSPRVFLDMGEQQLGAIRGMHEATQRNTDVPQLVNK
jgi:hypothetical protein